MCPGMGLYFVLFLFILFGVHRGFQIYKFISFFFYQIWAIWIIIFSTLFNFFSLSILSSPVILGSQLHMCYTCYYIPMDPEASFILKVLFVFHKLDNLYCLSSSSLKTFYYFFPNLLLDHPMNFLFRFFCLVLEFPIFFCNFSFSAEISIIFFSIVIIPALKILVG